GGGGRADQPGWSGARLGGAAVDRSALVRHLPVAVADRRARQPEPDDLQSAAGAARDGRRGGDRRPFVALRRGADPPWRARATVGAGPRGRVAIRRPPP